jgi:hypothetical protein
MVWRKMHQFEDAYDNPKKNGKSPEPWSSWMRIRLDDDRVDFDALIYFESNNRDDTTGDWFMKWNEDQLSREDILATDWEFIPEEVIGKDDI